MNLALPIGGRNFVVHMLDIGPRGGVRREWEMPFQQVILPTFRVEPKNRPPVDADDRNDLVVLRRGHTGSPELYEWWLAERDPKYSGRRTVNVLALDDAGRGVTGWSFTGCHLVALAYSPLDAIESTILTETAEIAFDDVTQSSVER